MFKDAQHFRTLERFGDWRNEVPQEARKEQKSQELKSGEAMKLAFLQLRTNTRI